MSPAREYELVLMLDPDIPDERREEITAEARQRIESGGSLKHDSGWGLRKLAYEIQQRTEADYRFFRFETEGTLLDELNHNLRIADGVLRFRIFKVDPRSPAIVPPPPQAAAAATPARGGRRQQAQSDQRAGGEEPSGDAQAAEAPEAEEAPGEPAAQEGGETAAAKPDDAPEPAAPEGGETAAAKPDDAPEPASEPASESEAGEQDR